MTAAVDAPGAATTDDAENPIAPGVSVSMIVTELLAACGSSTAPLGFDRLTPNTSDGVILLSSRIGTLIVWLATPEANWSVPCVAV